MTRRGLREQVFKMLFRVEFHNVEDMPEQMNMFEEVEECSEKDKEYISSKFHNIVEKIDEIDAAINEVSEGWKTRRMGKVDLTLIRLAVYEMKYEDDIPVKVAINEAVELAKQYGITGICKWSIGKISMMKNVYSVGQVNTYIKNMFAQDFMMQRISVKGEVSNCKYHSSGHIYFTLKDPAGTINAIMFAGYRRGLSFQMKEGDKVIVTGSVEVYERDGKYQLYAREIELDGAGNLYLKFEALKKYFRKKEYLCAAYFISGACAGGRCGKQYCKRYPCIRCTWRGCDHCRTRWRFHRGSVGV